MELVLLEGLAGNVERQVVRVDDAGDEAEVLWHHVLKVVGDKHTPDVHLDGVLPLAVVVVKAGRGSLWDEQDRPEGDLTFGGEVNVAHRGLALGLHEGVEEAGVLLLLDLLLVPGPDRLVGVDELVVPHGLLDLLWLLVGGVLFGFLLLGGNLSLERLDGVVDLVWHALEGSLGGLELLLEVVRDAVAVLVRLLLFLLDLFGVDLNHLARVEVDVEVDELRVLVDEVSDSVCLEEVLGLVLKVEADLGTTAELLVLPLVLHDRVRRGVRLPDVLVVVVVLRGHDDSVGDEEGRVETDTELADEVGRVGGASGHCSEEVAGAGLGDGTEVPDQVDLGHTNTRVLDVEHLVLLVDSDLDRELSVLAEVVLVP